MAHVTFTGDNIHEVEDKLKLVGVNTSEMKLPVRGPRVGIIMGSDSDLESMAEAAKVSTQYIRFPFLKMTVTFV